MEFTIEARYSVLIHVPTPSLHTQCSWLLRLSTLCEKKCLRAEVYTKHMKMHWSVSCQVWWLMLQILGFRNLEPRRNWETPLQCVVYGSVCWSGELRIFWFYRDHRQVTDFVLRKCSASDGNLFTASNFNKHKSIQIVGRGGPLVETMTFNRRVIGSTPALAAT